MSILYGIFRRYIRSGQIFGRNFKKIFDLQDFNSLKYRMLRSEMSTNSVNELIPSKRVINAKPSVWVEFTALAAEDKVVNLGQGFPDGSAPEFVSNLLENISLHPERTDWHQYTRGFGHPRLVKVLAELYSNLLGSEVNAQTDVLITVGAYLSLYYTFIGWLNHGDEVIILEPAYDCYVPQIIMAGAKPVPVLLELDKNPKSSSDYRVNAASIEASITPKTKMLVLNNPHNPTGKLFSRDELCAIADIARRYNLIVIADEVYEWHIYPGHEMIRFASIPGMFERTITIGSAGKAFSVTGWKTGWSIGPKELLAPLKSVHQNCIFTCSTPIQEAIAEAFEKEIKLLNSQPEKSHLATLMSSELQPKRDRVARMLKNAGLKPIIPDSGYFMIADFSDLINQVFTPDKSDDPLDFQFVRWLCREKKLATIPPSAFYSGEHKKTNDHFIRVCFFKEDKTLNSADDILQKLTNENRAN